MSGYKSYYHHLQITVFLAFMCLYPRTAAGLEGRFELLSYILDSKAIEVEVADNIAYSLFGSGLLVVDITDPADPLLLGRYFFQEAAEDLRLMGNLLIVADSTAGIQIIDVSDSSAPAFVGSYSTSGEAMGLDLRGDTLFVANGSRGLLVLTLDTPNDPRFIAEMTEVAPSYSVDVEGDFAYLADFQRGLDIVRVSNLPDLEFAANVSEWPCLVQARDVRVSQSHAYVADSDYLATVDITNPMKPLLDTCIEVSGRALDLFIELPYLYLASDVGGFHIFEIFTNPHIPEWQSTFDTPDDARGIAVENEVTVVADDFTGMLLVDVSNPSAPESLGTFISAGENRGGVISGNLSFISQGARGVTIATILDPVHPEVISTFAESVSFVHSLDVGDTLMAVANGFMGLMTVNITDPLIPSYIGKVATGRQVTEVKISGDMAFIVDGDFHAVDLSDPVNPTVVSSYTTPCFSVDLTMADEILFIADRDCGVHTFDISAPGDSIRLLATQNTPGIAAGIEVDEEYIYLADESGGFRVIRYTLDGNMDEIGQFDPGDEAIDVSVNGSVAYLTLRRGEIMAIDVGEPASPVLMDSYPTPGSSAAVGTGSSLILVGDVTSTIFLEFTPTGIGSDPSKTPPVPGAVGSLRQNYPNPFNPLTTITFSLPTELKRHQNNTSVSLEVFNLRGHLVKKLYQGIAPEGEHVVTWDGTNSSGESVSSGLYLYLLKIGEYNIVRKMLLVR
jgi:hypothetical protein